MDRNLYLKKVKILSRLIKESSLTLQESLILLDQETEISDNQEVRVYIVDGDTISCSNIEDGSTWNTTYSYKRYDETPTL